MHIMYNTTWALYELIKNLEENGHDSCIDKVDGLREWYAKEKEIMTMTREQRAAQIASADWYC